MKKQEIRSAHKKRLSQFSEIEYKVKSEKLSFNLETLLKDLGAIQDTFILGGFAPLKDEADWHSKLITLENNLAFPSTDDNGAMIFVKSRFDELVETEVFGVKILTPKEGLEEVTPDVLIIPGLGFSEKGERLGRGKGYYDKYLGQYNGIKIGICFNEMVVDNLPTEPHDINMDYVVTDGKIIKAVQI